MKKYFTTFQSNPFFFSIYNSINYFTSCYNQLRPSNKHINRIVNVFSAKTIKEQKLKSVTNVPTSLYGILYGYVFVVCSSWYGKNG